MSLQILLGFSELKTHWIPIALSNEKWSRIEDVCPIENGDIPLLPYFTSKTNNFLPSFVWIDNTEMSSTCSYSWLI